ncbi:MAG: ATP-dependent DNA ligase [Thaumarchaeota archaeon]|nr:ATP-dependent DNA ligase [Nitrososphaerota archaeon]
MPSPNELFTSFCKTCDEAASTPSKLKKIEILSEYIRSISASDLSFACRMLCGYVFPRGSEKELFVGYANVIRTLQELCTTSDKEFSRLYLKHGDLGKTAEELYAKQRLRPLFRNDLTLNRIAETFEKMAAIKGSGAASERQNILKGIYLDCAPLEAKYLSKIITGELRIGAVEGLVIEAAAQAFNQTPEDVRSASLVTGDIGLTVAYAKDCKLKEARIRIMHPTNFMLADSMPSPKEIAEYFKQPLLAEYKYDGVRAQAHKEGNQIKIFSRRLEDVSWTFPEIVGGLKKIEGNFVLDGEILAFREGKPLPFVQLQQRLRRKHLTQQILEQTPVTYLVYDVLQFNVEMLLGNPLAERRKLLETLKLEHPIHLSHLEEVESEEQIEQMFKQSKELGYEGLVLKKSSSPYEPGRRGKHWVKLKKELDTLDVVVVGAEYGHGKRVGVLSDYIFAVKSGDELKVIGKAYSGLTDKEILYMTENLKTLTIKDLGYRRLVKPKIILEVAFDNIQASNRHDSGYALRFPRIKRIRDDKTVEEIDTIKKVKEIYEQQSSVQNNRHS